MLSSAQRIERWKNFASPNIRNQAQTLSNTLYLNDTKVMYIRLLGDGEAIGKDSAAGQLCQNLLSQQSMSICFGLNYANQLTFELEINGTVVDDGFQNTGHNFPTDYNPELKITGVDYTLYPYWRVVSRNWYHITAENYARALRNYENQLIEKYNFTDSTNQLLFKVMRDQTMMNTVSKIDAYFGIDYSYGRPYNPNPQFVTCLRFSSVDIELFRLELRKIRNGMIGTDINRIPMLESIEVEFDDETIETNETSTPGIVIFQFLQPCPPTCNPPTTGG